MGRKQCTTKEQRPYLEGLIGDFLQAQAARTTKEFHDTTLADFVNQWPIDEPTDEQLVAEGAVKPSEGSSAKEQDTWNTAKAKFMEDALEALRKVSDIAL